MAKTKRIMKGSREVVLTNCKEVGSGSFGKVFVGEFEGKQYAVKRRYIARKHGDDGKIIERKDLPSGCIHLNEVDIMRRFNHPNLLHAEFIQQESPINDNFKFDSYTTQG